MINLVAKQYSAKTGGVWKQSRVSGSQHSVLWSKRKQKQDEDRIYHVLPDVLEDNKYGLLYAVICSRLGSLLGIPVLELHKRKALVKSNGEIKTVNIITYSDYKKARESEISLEDYMSLYEIGRSGALADLRNVDSLMINRNLDRLLAFDFLVCNQRRMGSDIQIVTSAYGYFRFAPFSGFEHTFTYQCGSDLGRIKAFVPMCEVFGEYYLGTNSLTENLTLLSAPALFKELPANYRGVIFRGITDKELPRAIKDKICEVIELRYSFLLKNDCITLKTEKELEEEERAREKAARLARERGLEEDMTLEDFIK